MNRQSSQLNNTWKTKKQGNVKRIPQKQYDNGCSEKKCRPSSIGHTRRKQNVIDKFNRQH